MAQIKLGELLIKANVLQEGQLKAALAEQAKWGGKLGEILVRMNFVSEDILVRALAKQLAIPAVNLDAVKDIPPHVLNRVPLQTARDFAVLPLQLRDDGKTLVVAISDPLNVRQLDELRAVTRCRIVPNVAGRTAIARAMTRFYDDPGELVDDAAAAEPAPAPMPRSPSREMSAVRGGPSSPVELLRGVEEVQRKEVAALKAMVELLIEKGVFTRDEYLAKVKR